MIKKGLTWTTTFSSLKRLLCLVFSAFFFSLSLSPLLSKPASAASQDTYATYSNSQLYYRTGMSNSYSWGSTFVSISPNIGGFARYALNTTYFTPSARYASVAINVILTSSEGTWSPVRASDFACSSTAGALSISNLALDNTILENGSRFYGNIITAYFDAVLPSTSRQSLWCSFARPDESPFFFVDPAPAETAIAVNSPVVTIFTNDSSFPSETPDYTNQLNNITNQNNQIIGGISDLNNSIGNLQNQSHKDAQDTQNAIKDAQDQAHKDSQQQLEESKKQTEAINETKDFITSNEAPEVDSSNLANASGWLPPGPVDSLLTLPVVFLQGIKNAFDSSDNCKPVSVPLPFVDKSISLPCMRPIFDQIGVTAIWEVIGGIVSAFVLFDTFKWLYKFVDDTLSFREENSTLWGGL